MTVVRRHSALFLGLLLATLGAAYILREPLLAAPAAWLNAGQSPRPAQAALVLAGGQDGERILRAGELVRDGFVPVAFVSGPAFYGVAESDLAIAFAARHGFPESSFRSLPNASRSTVEEAAACCDALRRAGVSNALLVTSAFHTRRAAAVYARVCRQIVFTPVAAEHPLFRNTEWYAHREGRKLILTEFLKTVAWRIGL